MIILYGTKTKTENVIWAGSKECPSCGQVHNFHMYKDTTYFTLFFIPIFPIIIQKYIACDGCGWVKKLKGKEYKEILRIQKELLDKGQFPKEIIVNDFVPHKLGIGWKLFKIILWILLGLITIVSVFMPIICIFACISAVKDYKLALKKKEVYNSLNITV